MADRPVRLGDVIDDYCPRCRLLLNHDVASLMGTEVAKVTCRTCHDTHDYRKGDVPKRKAKKDGKQQLMDQVLATLPLPAPAPPPAPLTEPPLPLPMRKKRDLWADLERIRKK